MADLTMGQVLRLDIVRAADPIILSGHAALHSPIRWVHVTESTENAGLLEGREVVLTTLRNVEPDPKHLREFLESLRDAGATGVLIEYYAGDRHMARELFERATAGLALPVVWLRHQVRFVQITEVIHKLLVAEQLRVVEFSRHVHEIYTELSLSEADEHTIVAKTAQLLHAPVVLEDVRHRVLAHAGAGKGAESVLEHWISRSRFVAYTETTGRGRGAEDWLQTPVGAVKSRWGRLVVPAVLEDQVQAAQVLERAGQTLTIARLAGRDQRELLYQARTSLLHELLQQHSLSDKEVHVRSAALGLETATHYVPVAIGLLLDSGQSPTGTQLREREVLEVIDQVAESMRLGVLSGSLRAGILAVILPVAAKELVDGTLQRFSRQLGESLTRPVAVGVGGGAASVAQCARNLEEAAQVAEIVPNLPTRAQPYYRFADLRLRGVLAAMGGDRRLRSFARTELAGLVDPPDTAGLELLELYLQHAGNKSALAKAGYLSRPTLYARLAKLEEKLGFSLESAESRTSLQVALMWYRLHG